MQELINKNKKILLIIGGLIILVLVVVILISGRSSVFNEVKKDDLIKIKGDNGSLTIERNGRVTLKTSDQEYSDRWSDEKISALLRYLEENSNTSLIGQRYIVIISEDGTTTTLAINEDDQLINTIIKDLTGGGDDGGDGDGDDPGDYFGSPTPAPTGGSDGGDDGDLPDGGPGEDYGHPECNFWKLSYCADPIPTLSPTPSPTDSPVEEGVFLESYCEAWNELGIGATIITNTVCVD